MLRQLVTNLLDNAIKHTPAGGAIAVGFLTCGESAVLTVSDSGPGIPAADRERVFERFVQLGADPARRSGAGLGLAIARWIAELHGGALILEDNRPHGCRFVARLPIQSGYALGMPARDRCTTAAATSIGTD